MSVVLMADQTFTTENDDTKQLKQYQKERTKLLDLYKQKLSFLKDHTTEMAVQPSKTKRQQATCESLLKLLNDYLIEQRNNEDTLQRLSNTNKTLWCQLTNLYETFTPLEIIGEQIQSSDVGQLQMAYEDQKETLNKRFQTLKILHRKFEDTNHIIMHHEEKLRILKELV